MKRKLFELAFAALLILAACGPSPIPVDPIDPLLETAQAVIQPEASATAPATQTASPEVTVPPIQEIPTATSSPEPSIATTTPLPSSTPDQTILIINLDENSIADYILDKSVLENKSLVWNLSPNGLTIVFVNQTIMLDRSDFTAQGRTYEGDNNYVHTYEHNGIAVYVVVPK